MWYPIALTSTSAGRRRLHEVGSGERGAGSRGGCIRPGRDLIGLPRCLDSPPRGLSPGSIPGDSLPTAPRSQDWWAGRGGGPAHQGRWERPGQTPFQEAACIKMPSCSSDCLFQAVEVRFFSASRIPPEAASPPEGVAEQSTLPALALPSPLGTPLPGNRSSETLWTVPGK